MSLALEPSSLPGFYELTEAGDHRSYPAAHDGTRILGTQAEWEAIANAIRRKSNESFSRCAVTHKGHYFSFSCPRNGYDEQSRATLFDTEVDEFLAHVATVFPRGAYQSDHGVVGLAGVER